MIKRHHWVYRGQMLCDPPPRSGRWDEHIHPLFWVDLGTDNTIADREDWYAQKDYRQFVAEQRVKGSPFSAHEPSSWCEECQRKARAMIRMEELET